MSGKLAGMKYVLGEDILSRGEVATMGMEMMRDFVSPISATVVRRLKDEGAIGGEGADFGVVVFGEKSDWKVKMKPTYGVVSRYGIAARSSSMDCVEVGADDIETIELVMGVIQGKDVNDATTLDGGWDNALDCVEGGCRVGDLGGAGMTILKYAKAIYDVVYCAELASAMMRCDGVRFGKQAKDVKNLDDLYLRSRDEGMSMELKKQIMLGNYVVSTGRYEKFYLKAQKARTLLVRECEQVFGKFDVLRCSADDAAAMAMISLMGLPAVTLPNGERLIGARCSDRCLLKYAKEVM